MWDSTLPFRYRRPLWTVGVSFTVCLLWLVSRHQPLLPRSRGSALSALITPSTTTGAAQKIRDVRNETLGFEKVFVINLKDRHDKLDAVQLAASLTGIHVDVIEGVRGADISNKALPPKGVPDQEHRHEAGFNNIAGCWRSHISFAQRIVSENLGSGLVMEDDADWSVYIKDQLELVAAGSQYISSTPVDSVPASPYGDDWDLLWLGHCGSDFGEPGTRRLVIENDATVPPPQHRVNNNVPDFSAAGYDNTTRVVYRAGGGLCTQAYALSLRGARKVLARFTTILDFQPIDHALHWMCHDRILDFKCVGVFPQLWASHRAAGHYNRDSDIQSLDNRGKEIREQAMTFNIVHSVRLNAARILVNGTAAVTSQWDDVPVLPGGVRVRYE